MPKRLPAIFFRSERGREPVRDFLKAMPVGDRQAVGRGIARVEFGWPIGMPAARSLGGGLHEVRVDLGGNRTIRVLFYVSDGGRMVLLHALVKKTRKTPPADLVLAQERMAAHRREN